MASQSRRLAAPKATRDREGKTAVTGPIEVDHIPPERNGGSGVNATGAVREQVQEIIGSRMFDQWYLINCKLTPMRAAVLAGSIRQRRVSIFRGTKVPSSVKAIHAASRKTNDGAGQLYVFVQVKKSPN